MKYDARACHFNMDTGCVELLLRDGRMISINCTGVEDALDVTMAQRFELASSCIVLHVHVLLKSCRSLYRSIYDFGFHLPRTPALNFPKKTNNPNPSPIGNKFGLFLFGPSGENRTHGLLNPIQARYQNCATPGHHPLPPYRSTGDMRYYTRIRQSCQQIFAIFLDFFEESMILTVMRCFASY